MSDHAAFDAFCDVLIPGDGDRWLPASAAIDTAAAVLDALSAADRDFLDAGMASMAELPQGARVSAMHALEAADQAAFGRVLAAVYAAYYTSAAAQACIRALAESGPRDASPHFDPDLLDAVLRRQAGRRRL